MKLEMMQIMSNERIAKGTYEMVLSGEIPHLIEEPGQFIHIKLNDESLPLRRPISIAAYNENQLRILYKVVGKGTKKLSELKDGDSLDVLGPLGNGFKLDNQLEHKKVLLVGAGIGIAPLYQLACDLQRYQVDLDIIMSFKSRDEVYYLDEFKKLGNVYLSTDDGTCGKRGYCKDVIEDLGSDYDYVYACGPIIVLKFVKEYFVDLDHVYLSLEQRMACGMGACYACDTKEKKKRICKDGPVFNGKEVSL